MLERIIVIIKEETVVAMCPVRLNMIPPLLCFCIGMHHFHWKQTERNIFIFQLEFSVCDAQVFERIYDERQNAISLDVTDKHPIISNVIQTLCVKQNKEKFFLLK